MMNIKKKNILVIDDEETILLGLSHILKKAGHDVVTAASGNEGSRLLGNTDFDLVITDLIMEGINGMGILEQARKKTSRRPEVIILSGYSLTPAVSEALLKWGGDFLIKPCQRAELLLKVEQCLKRREG